MKINSGQIDVAELIAQITGKSIPNPSLSHMDGTVLSQSIWKSQDIDEQLQKFVSSLFPGKVVGFVKADSMKDVWERRPSGMRLPSPTKIYIAETYSVKNIGMDDSMQGSGIPIIQLDLMNSKGEVSKRSFALKDFMDIDTKASDTEILSSLTPLLGKPGLYHKLHCNIKSLHAAVRVLNDSEKNRIEAAMAYMLEDYIALSTGSEAVNNAFPNND